MRIQLPREPVGFNMTPMIDVVFLLIIFFLVSSHLAQRESRIDVELPSAISGQDSDSDAHKLTLTLQRDGKLWLAGDRTTIDRLPRQLEQRRISVERELELRIRCDASVPYGDVEPLLGAAVGAGIWNVSFAATETRGVRPESP